VDQLELSTLLARCRAGDELAWEAFVRRFQGRVYALAYSYVGEREDARDLAQEIFVRLFETRERWADGDEFVPWLIHVSRNRSVDFLRRRKVRRPAIAVQEGEGFQIPDTSPDPEDRTVAASQRTLLHAALRGLSALSREVLVLRDVHGLSVQHVAAALGVPVGTVKSRASRARVELVAKIRALGGEARPGVAEP
jgi:RNA polymerase sigma-70 factor (ECF subfamily)